MSNQPIGIFDSGLGGFSILNEVRILLPNENFIYLADSKNAPYGDKSHDKIVHFSVKNTEKLITFDCKLIIVACNTATTNAINHLRETYAIPFIGIEPATKPAALNSNNNVIGVLATKGTLNSKLFLDTSEQFRSTTKIIEVEGAGLVKLIEENKINATEELLKKYTQEMLEHKIDYLVLGCTHYPFLKPILEKILPKHVTIIDSGKAVAQHTLNLLRDKNMLQTSNTQSNVTCYTNKDLDTLVSFMKNQNITANKMEYLNF